MKFSQPVLHKGSERLVSWNPQKGIVDDSISADVPVRKVAQNKIITFTLVMPPPQSHIAAKAPDWNNQSQNKKKKEFSTAEFRKMISAEKTHIARIRAFAKAFGLTVTNVSAHKRTIELKARAAAIEKAFGIEMYYFSNGKQEHLGYANHISLPPELHDDVLAVFGLDKRPYGLARRKPLKNKKAKSNLVSDTGAALPQFTPVEISRLYQFPEDLDGSGQCVGLIELDGGYKVSDMKTYFSGMGIPLPEIVPVPVKSKNTPGTSSDSEVVMDIQIVGALVPKAKIAVYFGTTDSDGFIATLQAAVHDTKNAPSVISISWGMSESNWTANEIKAFSNVLKDAQLKNITVLASSGDLGSANLYEFTDKVNVNYPASDTGLLSCGGTMISKKTDPATKQVVWNETRFQCTGGGISTVFPLPAWQAKAGVPPMYPGKTVKGRGLPDVSAIAVYYITFLNGKKFPNGGTSAVAPLWAALIAKLNQKLGKNVGYINPFIYSKQLKAKNLLQTITRGNNGAYKAKSPWSACTGLGSPDAPRLLAAFEK